MSKAEDKDCVQLGQGHNLTMWKMSNYYKSATKFYENVSWSQKFTILGSYATLEEGIVHVDLTEVYMIIYMYH